MNAITSRSRLKAVEPEIIEPKKPKVLVFGKPGVGKTWASLDFPKVYYIDTEGGADLDHYRAKLKNAGGVYLGPDQGSLDIDEIIEQVKALATEQHEFRTLVFDSISKLWNTALQNEQDRLGDKDSFGAFKKVPLRKFNDLLRWVNKLDMSVIFIAHSKDEWGKDDKGNREVVGETYDGPEKLAYDLHLLLNIVKTGNTRRARIGKSRLTGFPESTTFPWSYAEFAERYGKDVIERVSAPLALASVDQVNEVKRLLDVVRMPEDWQEKTFKKAEVEAWEEMDSAKIDAVINMLKGKLP
ncbi:MAG TPA: AAA family ATPase [Halothiobacillus sp.]|nr:AAA family ATPase [Halothiobacillus sp.]